MTYYLRLLLSLGDSMRIRHHKKYKGSGSNIKEATGRDSVKRYPYFVMVSPCRAAAEGDYVLNCTSLKWARIAAEHDFDRWLLECPESKIAVSVWEQTPLGDSLFVGEIFPNGKFHKKKYKKKRKSSLRRFFKIPFR